MHSFRPLHQLSLGDQFVFLERANEFAHIVFDRVPARVELAADRLYDVRLGRPALEKFQNSRPHRIQVEHLSLLDVEYDRAILPVRAPNSIRHSEHGLAPPARFIS